MYTKVLTFSPESMCSVSPPSFMLALRLFELQKQVTYVRGPRPRPVSVQRLPAASLPGAALMYWLGAMLRTCAFVFARQEVNLDLDCVAIHDNGAVIDEWLARVLLVAASSKQRLDRSVPSLP